jgi:hypothetical protein
MDHSPYFDRSLLDSRRGWGHSDTAVVSRLAAFVSDLPPYADLGPR